MHRATSDDAITHTRFDLCLSGFPQSVRETSKNVEPCNVPTYQCSIIYDMGSFKPKSEFLKPENLVKPVAKGESF